MRFCSDRCFLIQLVVFVIQISSCFASLCCNTFVWKDRLIFQGFFQDDNELLWTGQLTANGVRINCMVTLMFMILGNLIDAILHDPEHKYLYFVDREPVVKPDAKPRMSWTPIPD